MSTETMQYQEQGADFDELRSIIVGEQNFAHQEEFIAFQKLVLERLDQLEAKIEDKVTFETKLVGSKDRMVDVISPQMGKIIRSSVNHQVEKVVEKITETSNKVYSIFTLKGLKQRLFGEPKTIYANYPKIIQLFIIEKDSGLLIGKFEKERITDPDMMTGILTSVKAFAESSLDLNDAEIGLIDYGEYFIKMFSYGTYYFALVLTGTQNRDFEDFIVGEIEGFANLHVKHLTNPNRANIDFDLEIDTYFEATCQKLEKK